jgi:hypothetical protein
LKLYSCLSPCASTNSKWIKDINIRPETLKLGNTLELNRTQIVEKLRQRIDKYEKKKRNCHQIEEIAHRMGKNVCQLYIWQENNYQIMHGLKKTLNSSKINDSMKKWLSELNRSFSKNEVQMAKKMLAEMLNIPGHKGNANQNQDCILPHSC